MSNAHRCDPDVYENGIGVGFFRNLSPPTIETILADWRQYLKPGAKVDWHYMGGRAVVRVLGSPRDRQEIRELMRGIVYVAEEGE